MGVPRMTPVCRGKGEFIVGSGCWVVARDRSVLRLTPRARVHARDRSRVEAVDGCTVIAGDFASVRACGDAVVEARAFSTVVALGPVEVQAGHWAEVWCDDETILGFEPGVRVNGEIMTWEQEMTWEDET